MDRWRSTRSSATSSRRRQPGASSARPGAGDRAARRRDAGRALADVEAERAELAARTPPHPAPKLDAVEADPAQYQEPQDRNPAPGAGDEAVLQDLIETSKTSIPELLHRRRLVAQLCLSRDRRRAAGDHHRPGTPAEAIGEGLPGEGLPARGVAGDPRAGAVQHVLRRGPQAARWLTSRRRAAPRPSSAGSSAIAARTWSWCRPAITARRAPPVARPLWTDAGQQHDMVLLPPGRLPGSITIAAWSATMPTSASARPTRSAASSRCSPSTPAARSCCRACPSAFEYLDAGDAARGQLRCRAGHGPADHRSPTRNVRAERLPRLPGCGLVVSGPADPDDGRRLPTHNTQLSATQSGEGQWHNTLPLSRDDLRGAAHPAAGVDGAGRREAGDLRGLPRPGAAAQVRRRSRTTCRSCRISEPASDGTRRRYLVIYDTVPGGTSFLRDLASPDAFRRRAAAGAGHAAQLSLPPRTQKQACYRCLYSYRGQHDLELISREMGVEMLE